MMSNDDKDDWLESAADEGPELHIHLCMRQVVCHVHGMNGLQLHTYVHPPTSAWKNLHKIIY